jgi:type IV pilus assembly protein PilP
LSALHIQQLPLHWQVQGSWEAWLNWLTQWQTSAPGVTVSSLELKADPRGGISAQVVAVAPQPTAHEAPFALSSLSAEDATSTDPFNAQAWIHAQRMRAQQHPSYAKLVEPELLRPRAPLEAFPRERLQYVGQISAGADVDALVKVLPAAGGNKDPSMMTVHRVRVGGYLGHDFGRVMAISPDHLMLQELVLNATGEWLIREATLPLKDAAP